MAASLCVVGLGRVGLPMAALFARAGLHVTGVDRDPARLEALRGGRAGPEPGLSALLSGAPIRFTSEPARADAYLLCVGTPLLGRRADLRDLDAVVTTLASVAAPDALVVIASTVPVGTTDAVAATLSPRDVAVAPERVLPGDALREIRDNPRLVGGTPRARERATALLQQVVSGPISQTDARTAELAKLVENAARDVQIALANTVAGTARRLGVDPLELIAHVNQHPRVALLRPGVGVGGHCLPVDPWFLIDAAPEESALFRTARAVNDAVPFDWAERVAGYCAPGDGPVGVLGLTYKADCDDVRESPALALVRALIARGLRVCAHDPYVDVLPGVPLVSVRETLQCPVVVRAVPHRAYDGLRPTDRRVVDVCGGWR